VLEMPGVKEYWRSDTPLILQMDCAPVHVSRETREVLKDFPHIITVFVPPTFTGQLQALDVKFFGPFKQKLRAIQLNNWVKHFVHGTKEPKVSVPTAKAARWNMLTALQETLKGSQPAATATGEFMRKSFHGNFRPAANASHVFFPTVKTPVARIRQCYETQRPDKKDEKFYVYPLFTLKGQTPDIVLDNRESDKPTPRYLPRSVKELALTKLPEYKDLLREEDPSAVNGRADDGEDEDPQRDDADEVAVLDEEDVTDIAKQQTVKCKLKKADEAKKAAKSEAKRATKKARREAESSSSSESSGSASSSASSCSTRSSSSRSSEGLASSASSAVTTPRSDSRRRSRSRTK
jgi:hypothetical protein